MNEPEKNIRTLIVGGGAAGMMTAQEMAQRPEHGYVVVGFLDDDPEKLGREIAGAPVLGHIGDLVAVAEEHDIQEIVVAIPSASRRPLSAVSAPIS